jgi:membrane-associated phospholipid phosphatase
MNFADRVYAAWFLILSLALAVHSKPVGESLPFVAFPASVIAIIAVTSIRSNGAAGWRVAHDWYPMILFVVAFEEVARLSLAFVPNWQDGTILRLEAAVFSQPPTQWLGHFHHPVVAEALEFGYFSFYWMLPLVGIVLYGRGWSKTEKGLRPFRLWMDALAIGYMTCFTVYLLFPTEGPAHTLGYHEMILSGPFRRLVLLIQRHGGVHGNAFPSGHIMAASVCVLAALRWVPRLGRWLIVPLVLMCVGAVYDDYHYVSDVLAGAILGAAAFSMALYLLESRADGVNLEAHE